jgi:3'-phosphoadenosine 5'-phosphosulfate sulfotransferase (PAPS reductase)/FAD synthetase
MRHVITFSGGKDSTALILWARENLAAFDTVFCDTGWESEMTYSYIEYIDRLLLNGSLIRLSSEGMPNLVARKKRVPSARARFCTSELKVLPMINWLKDIDDDITVYQGIRAQESATRSNMKQSDWSDEYDAHIERPLFHWTHEEVFEMHKKHDIDINPMYLLGARRVGCFPCVMISHRELKAMTITMPEVWDQIEKLEEISGRTFFPPKYIPQWAMTSKDPKTGKKICFAKDVRKYIIEKQEQQLPLLPIVQCMSAYNLCE